jgi:hypothetical protein
MAEKWEGNIKINLMEGAENNMDLTVMAKDMA